MHSVRLQDARAGGAWHRTAPLVRSRAAEKAAERATPLATVTERGLELGKSLAEAVKDTGVKCSSARAPSRGSRPRNSPFGWELRLRALIIRAARRRGARGARRGGACLMWSVRLHS